MAKILSVYNRLQAGDYENGNGGKRRVSRLTQFIHATLQLFSLLGDFAVDPARDFAPRLTVLCRSTGTCGFSAIARPATYDMLLLHSSRNVM